MAAADPIRAEMIRALYGRTNDLTYGSVIAISFMAVAAWPYSSHIAVLAWLAVQIVFQVWREALRRAFVRRAPSDEDTERWAHAYLVYMAGQGCVWGSTIFLFVHPEHPITLALTLCCLYGVIGGGLPGNSYYPPSIIAVMTAVFGSVVVRTIATGQFDYMVVGVAHFLLLIVMSAVCRTQYRALRESFRIRFENIDLVRALTHEKAEAEAARRQAESASLAKSQFLAAASHDLRQPLYALSLFSASLQSLELDEEGRAIVDRIGDSITAMEELFVGLLDISRLEAGTVAPRLAAVSVDALFDRLSQVYRPIAREKGLDLRFRSDGEWVLGDVVLVEQVLSNLMSNAIRATALGGILLAARRRNAAVRLELWDTGVGIGEDDRARIFDEFVQLGNPERDRRKGLGLGLSIARRAAALLGASIEVRSRVGKGSRFALALPLVAQPEPDERHRALPMTPALPRDHTLPVLVVEDDVDVRAGLQRLLERWGVAHDAVADAEGALAAFAEKPYGLVLSDQRLGGAMDGVSLLHEIGRRCAAAPPAMALITGEFDAQFASIAASRAIPVLAKPVRGEQLRGLLGLSQTVTGT